MSSAANRDVPARVLLVSLASLAFPVAATLVDFRAAPDYEVLLWLLGLVPAFLLAYYRGWRGVGAALAVGIAALAIVQLVILLSGHAVRYGGLLAGVIAAYIAIALGVGWLSERLHRERARAEALALTDELTGLPNRRWARLFLDTEFAAAQRGRSLALVLFDLDGLKQTNDRHGHAAGDQLLLAVSEILQRVTRRMNLTARVGGDEFLSVLSSSEVPGALVFVDRIRSELRKVRIGEEPVTLSAGVARFRPEMATPEELLAAADAALYEAKAHGGDCVRVAGDPRQAAAV